MKNVKRYPEVYRIASEYTLALLGYEGHNMRPTEAHTAVREIARKLGWSSEKREQIWSFELRCAFQMWDVPISELMACSH